MIRGHLPAGDHGVMDPAPAPYLIRINGHLGASALSAFSALAPQHQGAHTVLTIMGEELGQTHSPGSAAGIAQLRRPA